MKKYGYVFKIDDTPNDNFWTHKREIELLNGSIIYGLEGVFNIEEGKGEMFSKSDFLIWLSENAKQQDLE